MGMPAIRIGVSREMDTNFGCVDANSLVPERLLKEDTTTRVVRYQGFDEDLDDWVPMSELPIRCDS